MIVCSSRTFQGYPPKPTLGSLYCDLEIKIIKEYPNLKQREVQIGCGILFESTQCEFILMAWPKPLITEIGIPDRLESCTQIQHGSKEEN